jgi:lipopolysaccharide biosynthesis glycosyltransferase
MKDYCILYFCDEGLHLETCFSMASLAKFSSESLEIVFLQQGYSKALPQTLVDYIVSRGHRVVVEEFNAAEIKGGLGSNSYFGGTGLTSTTFGKVDAINYLIDDYLWIFYLDGDTLFLDDPELSRITGFKQPIAACLDLAEASGYWNLPFFENCKKNQVSPQYFNAGFMCVNSAVWRLENVKGSYLKNIEEHSLKCPYKYPCIDSDQCPLNMTFDGRWAILTPSLNIQRCVLHTRLWDEALMRHYTGGRHKFLPILRRRCDRREYRLLCEISSVCDHSTGIRFYDWGLSNFLNRIRRWKVVKAMNEYVDSLL